MSKKKHGSELFRQGIMQNAIDAGIFNPDKTVNIPKTYIDITPRGMSTLEGRAKVATAQEEWNSAAHALSNAVTSSSKIMVNRLLRIWESVKTCISFELLIGARQRKQDAFLRAVAG